MDDLPKTRADAKTAGSKKYFTGKPCKHNHVAPRYTDSGTCQMCIMANLQTERRPVASVAVERDLLQPFGVRVSAENYRRVLELAVNLTRIRYPNLQAGDVERRKGGKDSAGGLLLYTLHMDAQDAQIVRQYAASFIPKVDITQARWNLVSLALERAQIDRRSYEPEFRP